MVMMLLHWLRGTEIVDVIGQIGFDPPSGEWGTGDVSTQDNTIKAEILNWYW